MPARTCLVLTILLLAAPSWAEPEPSAARKAADAVVLRLPAPSPAIHVDYEGDLLVGGQWAGEVRYTARATKIGRQVVWRVTRDTYIDHAGQETRIRLMVHLKPDLSILSGTYERKEKRRSVSAAFSRSAKGLLVQRRVVQGDADPESGLQELALAARTTTSVGALLLFLRAAAPEPGTKYELPWLSSADLQREPGASVPSPMLLTVHGKETWGEGKQKRETVRVDARHGDVSFSLRLTPDRRGLVGIRMPKGQGDVVPRGEGGERLTVKPDEPAATWKDAFLKFGFGYHLPRRSLLAEAFHWQAMYEHETKVLGRWDAKRPLSEFKQAWIDEFVAQSKNRSIHDARRLLSMTLGTGKMKKQTKDEVVFAAHPNFGGGVQRTYYLRRVDGVWGIVRIEF